MGLYEKRFRAYWRSNEIILPKGSSARLISHFLFQTSLIKFVCFDDEQLLKIYEVGVLTRFPRLMRHVRLCSVATGGVDLIRSGDALHV